MFPTNGKSVCREMPFFDVAKKQKQPFWIDTKEVKIEVLGTAFSVKSVEDAPFRLSVQRGTVRVTR